MKTYDTIIVGGGIIGGAIAFELARRKFGVLLLDSQSPGQEASWAAAGMLSPPPDSADAIPLVPLGRASLEIYPEFIEAIEEISGEKTGYRPNGAMEVFFGNDADRKLSTLIAVHHGLGLTAEVLRIDEAFELEPHLSRDLGAAALLRSEASVDNRALTRAVLRAAEASGAEIRSGCPVEAALQAAKRCTGVIAAGERIEAKNTVIAAGCFSARIEGVSQYAPVRPVRGQMVALNSERVEIGHVLRSEHGYIVPRGGGMCVAGSTLEQVGFEKRVTPDGIGKILAAAVEIAPGLAGASITESWSGLRPDTPDHLPILGPTDVEGLLIATGHFRNGILLTPITARLIADWITAQRTIVSGDKFGPMRFVESSRAFA
ncbi:MAG TPA: glycine oxidase ThiO [Candidatus Limnocylindrales bacterium]|nr:glycine oxidase ThiO [Candidatus Limnocylindrales bacterium]